MIPELKKTTEQKMQKTLESLKTDFGKVRTGRAHTGILDHIQVDYYGSMQRREREYREDLNQRRNEELAGVLDKANKAIKVIAEAEKYDLILQEVVYRSARIDITEKVLKALADPPAAAATK